MEQNDIDENVRRLKRAGQLGITCAMLSVIEQLENQVAELYEIVSDLRSRVSALEPGNE